MKYLGVLQDGVCGDVSRWCRCSGVSFGGHMLWGWPKALFSSRCCCRGNRDLVPLPFCTILTAALGSSLKTGGYCPGRRGGETLRAHTKFNWLSCWSTEGWVKGNLLTAAAPDSHMRCSSAHLVTQTTRGKLYHKNYQGFTNTTLQLTGNKIGLPMYKPCSTFKYLTVKHFSESIKQYRMGLPVLFWCHFTLVCVILLSSLHRLCLSLAFQQPISHYLSTCSHALSKPLICTCCSVWLPCLPSAFYT